MPTENRSSNTEMVGVPRDLIDLALAHLPNDSAAKWEIHEVLAQPAPQHHAEPIAWMVGTAIWWTKEEAERDAAATGLPIVGLGPTTSVAPTEQQQGEPAALPMRRSWSGIAGWRDQAEIKAWNACLDEIAKLGPLYTRADPSEVERLRDGLKYEGQRAALCLEELQECETQRDEFYAEITGLRAQLAEAHALLREADEFMYIMTAHDGHAKLAHRYGKDWWDAIDKLRGKVCTALSASAEPEAT